MGVRLVCSSGRAVRPSGAARGWCTVEVVSDDVPCFFCVRPANDAGLGGYVGASGDADEIRFYLCVGAGRVVGCREVRGFHEAVMAAEDELAEAPPRLWLSGLDDDARAFIEAWSEDCERVRRTLSIRRLLDDRELTAVVTLASYGPGVETSLSLESLTPGPVGAIPALLRSGVHPRATVEAVLGLSRNARAGSGDVEDDAGWLIQT